MGSVKQFVEQQFRHFNARILKDAAQAWNHHLEQGGKMLLAMAGAMSTAEIGRVLAELIRRDKVHALSVTGANLEEDVFNLVAHDDYEVIANFREFGPEDDRQLLQRGMNRVTDTCIPEEQAMRKIERHLLELWQQADREKKRHTPHEFFYQLLLERRLEADYQIDARNSWLLAAAEKKLHIAVPGWEDSSTGNVFVAQVLKGRLSGYHIVKSGLEQLAALVGWYREQSARHSIGFFQIGGGIAGDFSICSVPLIEQDLREPARKWGYFCQISDSTTSYGSYSGAPPSEKVSWGKLDPDTPRFVIESDATIVFPLIAAYLLDL